MATEVQVTRGTGYGVAGDDPIALEEWRGIVETHAEIVPQRGESMARLGGRPLVFRNGIISAIAPGDADLDVLRAAARELRARMFAADGAELGLTLRDDIVRVIGAAFAGVDASGITDDLARHLVAVSDPSASLDARREALTACRELEGSAAIAGAAYLLRRATLARGEPSATVTCAAAHLLRYRPTLLDSLRQAPTQAWAQEVDDLRLQIGKSAGAYVVRRCHDCNAKNRVAVLAEPGQLPKCGRCKTFLAAVD